MTQMWLVVLTAGCLALGLGSIVAMHLQQEEHRRSGILPGPDPRTSLGSLLDAVLGAVPISQVRQGGVAFEDGTGILFSRPDRTGLDQLGRLAAAREVVLERVYELRDGLLLVFRGGDTRLHVDVGALQVVAP